MSLLRLFAPLLLLSAVVPSSAQDATAVTDTRPTFIFASDTQEPMRIEEVLLRSNENKRATRALFKDMLAQRPTELFLLGDVVNLGYKADRWTFIDTALALACERGFNVHALLGNHELMGLAGKGERNFQLRFPEHVRTGYVVRKDSIAVVLLNSNLSKLSKADVLRQQRWYTSTLAQLDSASDIRTILVCCHHSPYSQSKMVGSSTVVQRSFVIPFMKARKTSLFISGHAHLFEHFRVEDKHFFVIGGGGGLHHPLSSNPGAHMCLEPDYDPLFHYLTIQLRQDALSVVSHRLKDDLSGFEEGCDFVFSLPTLPVSAGERSSP